VGSTAIMSFHYIWGQDEPEKRKETGIRRRPKQTAARTTQRLPSEGGGGQFSGNPRTVGKGDQGGISPLVGRGGGDGGGGADWMSDILYNYDSGGRKVPEGEKESNRLSHSLREKDWVSKGREKGKTRVKKK